MKFKSNSDSGEIPAENSTPDCSREPDSDNENDAAGPHADDANNASDRALVGPPPISTKQSDTNGRKEFPLDSLPEVLRHYVAEISDVRGVPAGLIAPSVLTSISASLGAGIQMETWEGKTTRPNLYWIGIASSGVGKGTVCDEVFAPMLKVENSIIEDWRNDKLPQVRAAESMIKEQIKSIKKEATKGQCDWTEAFTEIATLEKQLDAAARLKVEPRSVCEDVTREKLGDLLSAQPGEALASVSSEARGILDVLTRMKGEDIYTKAWSGESYRNDRRSTKNLRLNRPCLTVCWMIQEDAWANLVENESFIRSGMLPRFLFSAPEVPLVPLPAIPRRFAPQVKAAYSDLIVSLLKQYRHNEQPSWTVITTPAVVSLYSDYENKIRAERSPGGVLQDISSFAARWTENAFRLGLVLHAATHGADAHGHSLALETAEASLDITEWFRAEQVRLLSEHMTQADQKRANRLEEAVRRYGTGPATVRDLVTRNGFKEAEIIKLVDRRPERFKIVEHRQEKGSKGGRPSRAVELVQQLRKTAPFPDMVGGIAGNGGFAGGANFGS